MLSFCIVKKIKVNWTLIQEVKKRFKDGLPLLDPIDDMGIKDEGLKSIVRVLLL